MLPIGTTHGARERQMDIPSLLIGTLIGVALMGAIFIGTDRALDRRKSSPEFVIRASDKFAVRT